MSRLLRAHNVAIIALALVAPLLFMMQLTHDAAWQIWIGRQIVLGSNLYTDIIEVNPPLWFWLAAPIAELSDITGVNGLDILIIAFLLIIALAIGLSSKLLPSYWPDKRRFIFFVGFLIAVIPPGNFGQREHFTLISTIPYVLLIARRSTGETVPPKLAVLIGIFAATGFALKPHFAIVPLALEAWLRRPSVRPEIITLVVSAICYALVVILFERDFFTNSASLTLRAYSDFGQFDVRMLFPSLIPLLIGVIFFASPGTTAAAFLVASLAFYLAFVSQLKGFAYHVLPAMGMLVLATASSALARPVVRWVAALTIVVLAILPNLAPYKTKAWADVPRGASYAALSVAPRAGWPLVEERNLTWTLRYMSLWMAPALGDELRGAVINDIHCNPPTFLLVDDREFPFSSLVPDVLDHYTTIHRHKGITLMKLERSFPKPPNCRQIR